MKKLKAKTLLIICAFAVLSLQGCANVGKVEAFEKGYLAKEAMTFKGDILEAKFHEHIYGSKENASGGSGVGGGGCGCN
jgi:outer membrane lipoprotein SlyB